MVVPWPSRGTSGDHFGSPGPPGAPPETNFGTPGHLRELEKVLSGTPWELEKMILGKILGTPWESVAESAENAVPVHKNRGPQKPVLVSEREARKLVLKVQLYPAKHVLGRVLPTKHYKKHFCIPGRAH